MKTLPGNVATSAWVAEYIPGDTPGSSTQNFTFSVSVALMPYV